MTVTDSAEIELHDEMKLMRTIAESIGESEWFPRMFGVVMTVDGLAVSEIHPDRLRVENAVALLRIHTLPAASSDETPQHVLTLMKPDGYCIQLSVPTGDFRFGADVVLNSTDRKFMTMTLAYSLVKI